MSGMSACVRGAAAAGVVAVVVIVIGKLLPASTKRRGMLPFRHRLLRREPQTAGST